MADKGQGRKKGRESVCVWGGGSARITALNFHLLPISESNFERERSRVGEKKKRKRERDKEVSSTGESASTHYLMRAGEGKLVTVGRVTSRC